MHKLHTQQQNGFLILFAILISAIILLIGAGIFSISVKETLLSSVARESQKALYAADAGAECGIFVAMQTTPLVASDDFPCGGENVRLSSGVFGLTFSAPVGDGCSQVTIVTGDEDDGVIYTTIYSEGYNVCYRDGNDYLPDDQDPLLVERVFRVRLQTGVTEADVNFEGDSTSIIDAQDPSDGRVNPPSTGANTVVPPVRQAGEGLSGALDDAGPLESN